jgi:hypothetical protein
MSKKCAVCSSKISFWAVEYTLNNKYTDIYVCDTCDSLLRLARNGKKESLAKLKNKVTDEATDQVKQYIESLNDIEVKQIEEKPHYDETVINDEEIGVARKTAINKIKYSEDENLIKTYCCSIMSSPYGKGYLLVTNKRVIYTGLTKKSCFVNEMDIDKVSGINTMYGKRVKLTKLLFGILLAILGIVGIFINNEYYYDNIINIPTFILLATALILMITRIKKCFKLAIYATKALGTPINVATDKGDINNLMFSLSAKPTKETDKMMFELGALIRDIQTMGDNAIDKWSS